MAVWHYSLSLVPEEGVQALPSQDAKYLAETYGVSDSVNYSPLWQCRPVATREIYDTLCRILKPSKDLTSLVNGYVYGSSKRWQVFLVDDQGWVKDLFCTIDVHAMQEMSHILSEVLTLAKEHRLMGINDESGVVPLESSTHLLKSVSLSRAVRYVRDPENFLRHTQETYHLSPAPEAPAETPSKPASPVEPEPVK